LRSLELLKGNRKWSLKQIKLEEKSLQYQQWQLWTWQHVINFLKHSYITNTFLTVRCFSVHLNNITVHKIEQKPTRCTPVLKSQNSFTAIYVALHVSDTIVSIIRSLPPLHTQPLATVWFRVGCVLQHCSVCSILWMMMHGTMNVNITVLGIDSITIKHSLLVKV
jgi:hypothetical protein